MRRLDPDKAVRDFGRRVAELRVDRGWTQEALAEEWQCSTRYVQNTEQGRENLTIKSVAKLANVLGVPMAELFLGPSTPPPRRGRPARSKPAKTRAR
jgi:transcriptional regulator with XRE-family HTH domain